MKKILLTLALMLSMTFVGCTEEELPKIGPDKEEPAVEETKEEVKEPVIEKTEEEVLCDKIYETYKLLASFKDDTDTFKILATKSMSKYIGDGSDTLKLAEGTTEVLTILKGAYDIIDAEYDKEFYVVLETTDGNSASIFRTNDGVYYTNCFGVTIDDINVWVK